MIIISFDDNGFDKYLIKSPTKCLGRRWDNNAESIKVNIPEKEKNNSCIMIVTRQGKIIDYINVGEDDILVTSNLSQYDSVEIGFSFSGKDNYVKNSDIKKFYFLEAQKPDDFVAVEPEQIGKFEELLGLSFTDVTLKEGTLNTFQFRNLAGSVIKEITITGTGSGSGSTESGTTDYNELENKPSINGVALEGNKKPEELGILSKETDPSVPQYVKDITEQDIYNWNNKSNFSGSYNDLTDKPTNNATTDYVDQKVADLVNSAPETLDTLGEVAQAIEENADVVEALNNAIGNKADKSSVPKFTATQLEDNSYSLTIE